MRVLVLVKSDPTTEEGQLPDERLVTEMTRYNDELANAGVLDAADGLYPSSKGKRVRFDGTQRSVIDGPFSDAKELVAGFWIWQVRSIEEAVDWLKRAPFEGGTVEIRPIQEAEDFLADYSPELQAEGRRQQAELAARQKS